MNKVAISTLRNMIPPFFIFSLFPLDYIFIFIRGEPIGSNSDAYSWGMDERRWFSKIRKSLNWEWALNLCRAHCNQKLQPLLHWQLRLIIYSLDSEISVLGVYVTDRQYRLYLRLQYYQHQLLEVVIY